MSDTAVGCRFTLVVAVTARSRVRQNDRESGDWQLGPWAPRMPVLEVDANEDARRSYFLPRVADALVASAFRQHRIIEGGGGVSWAIERWQVPEQGAVQVFAAHALGTAEADDGADEGWMRLETEAIDVLASLDLDLTGDEIRHRVVFDRRAGGEPDRRARAFALATANPDADRFGTEYLDQLGLRSPHLSDDWTCLVTRDGTAFVAGDGESDFLSLAPWLVSTVYSDVCMLAVAQASILEYLTERLARLAPVVSALPAIRDIENDWSAARHRLWWARVARSQTANDLLAALQENLGGETTRVELRQDLADHARSISLQISEVEAAADRRLNRLVSVLTVLLGPAVIVDVVATIITTPSRQVSWALTGLLVAGVALATDMMRRLR